MRGRVLFFVGLLLLVCLGGSIAYRNLSQKESQRKLMERFPTFQIPNVEGELVEFSSLLQDAPTVIVYFNSTCPICQSEAELLSENFKGDSSVHFVFISSERVEVVDKFKDSYQLNKLSRVSFLSDTLYQFAGFFKLTTVPATLVYNQDGKLIELFRGVVSMPDMKSAIQKTYESSR